MVDVTKKSEEGNSFEINMGYEDSVYIGDSVKVKILERVGDNYVKMGIIAPKNVPVHREEVYNDIADFKKSTNSFYESEGDK